MNYHKNIKKFYMYTIFRSMVFAYVIERLFWASRGMSVMDVVYTEIIYSVIIIALELPTGMLADMFSRKTWLCFDTVLSLLEFVIIIFATNFWHFVIAIGLSGVGHAFQSGATNALIYDTLKSTGHEEDFEKLLGRLKAFEYSTHILCGLIGGIVASKMPLVTTYWMSLLGIVMAIIVALTIKEERDNEHKNTVFGVKEWQEISGFIFTEKSIRYVAVVGMISAGALNYMDEFWQLYLEALEVPVIMFGVFEVIAFGAVAIGGAIAYKFKDRLGVFKSFRYMLIVALVSYAVISLIRQQSIIIVCTALYFAMAVIEPLVYGYLHDKALPKYRATIESAFSFLTMVAIAVIGLPFGLLSTTIHIFAGFVYLTAVMALLVLYYFTRNRRFENA